MTLVRKGIDVNEHERISNFIRQKSTKGTVLYKGIIRTVIQLF